MPTILRIKGYRIWFYEADLAEPPHVHVGKARNEAKFWINPVRLARPGRFQTHELAEIERILAEHEAAILEAWNGEQQKRNP